MQFLIFFCYDATLSYFEYYTSRWNKENEQWMEMSEQVDRIVSSATRKYKNDLQEVANNDLLLEKVFVGSTAQILYFTCCIHSLEISS